MLSVNGGCYRFDGNQHRRPNRVAVLAAGALLVETNSGRGHTQDRPRRSFRCEAPDPDSTGRRRSRGGPSFPLLLLVNAGLLLPPNAPSTSRRQDRHSRWDAAQQVEIIRLAIALSTVARGESSWR